MELPELDPWLLSVCDVATVLRIGRSKAYQMLANGELPGVVRLGRAVRVSAKILWDWIDQQAAASGESHAAVLLADHPTVIGVEDGRRSPDRLRGGHGGPGGYTGERDDDLSSSSA